MAERVLHPIKALRRWRAARKAWKWLDSQSQPIANER